MPNLRNFTPLKNITFLGLGNLARMMISRLALDPKDTSLINGYSPSIPQIPHVYSHLSMEQALQASKPEYIFYLFKPQHWNSELKNTIQRSLPQAANKPLKISFIAGLSIEELGCDVSCMINILGEVGLSYMISRASDNVTDEQKQQVANLLQNLGPMHWVSRQDDMHLAVACTGSAPAYVLFAMQKATSILTLMGIPEKEAQRLVIEEFTATTELFKQKLESSDTINWPELYAESAANNNRVIILKLIASYCRAMQQLGLDTDLSYKIAWHTFLGSAKLVDKKYHASTDPVDIAAIIKKIMSKGGTTEKAIEVARNATLDIFSSAASLDEFFYNMLKAARDQSIFLQDSKKKVSELEGNSLFAYKTPEETPKKTDMQKVMSY